MIETVWMHLWHKNGDRKSCKKCIVSSAYVSNNIDEKNLIE